MNNSSRDIAALKDAARGRWVEILSSLGGIDPAVLDGAHHPCPWCLDHGTDRFSLVDFVEGAVLCRRCFSKRNGDGFAALRKANGWTFPQACDAVAEFLGVNLKTSGRNGRRRNSTVKATCASSTRVDDHTDLKREPGSGASLLAQVDWVVPGGVDLGRLFHLDRAISAWSRTKQGVTPESAKAFAARYCRWPRQNWRFDCLAFAGRTIEEPAEPKAILLYRADGQHFPAVGELKARKTHLVRGSGESWLWPAKTDPRQTDVIVKTEGLTDALALWGLGLPAGWLVMTNACGAGSSNPNKLDFSFARDKKVVVLGDADRPGEVGARGYVCRFHDAGAAEVRYPRLSFPGVGKDVRDWINAGNGLEAFLTLLESSPPVTNEQVTEWRGGNATACQSGEGREDEDKESIVKLLADEICSSHHFAQDASGRLYYYVDGAYKPGGDKVIAKEVKRLCLAWACTKDWSTRRVEQVVAFIQVDAPELWPRPPEDVVNVQNGLLYVTNRNLLPHDPAYLTSVQLPVTYDPTATCPASDQFIADVFPADAANLAWEILGWLMVPAVHLQKAVLATGEGANGKSTWLAQVTAFLGPGNVSGLSLQKLEADRFSVARLVGKLANICPDLPSDHLVSTGTFKAITGGDKLLGERKFGESFEFEPFARLVFSANHLPRSKDASFAFFRRWQVIHFGRTFSGAQMVDRKVMDARLSASGELSGVLNRAIDGLDRLRAQRAFSEPESCKAAWQEFVAETDPLAIWLDQFTVDDPNLHVRMDTLRAAYNASCEQAGRPSMNKTAFGRAIKQHRPKVREGQRENKKWAYLGIGLLYDDIRGGCGVDESLSTRSSRSPSYSLYRRGNSECDSEWNNKEVYESREQNKGNSVNPVNCATANNEECPHEWIDAMEGNRVKTICRRCGAFRGYRPVGPVA